jgi:Cys-tRNA(Pro) deacylase
MSEPIAILSPHDLARFIVEQAIDAQIMPVDIDTPTVSDAARALGIQTAQIIKTLLFVVKDAPVVVIANGDMVVDRHPLAARFAVGKKQVKLADVETVQRVLGYPAGGVPPFGHTTAVPVLLDEKMRGWDVVYGGGGDHRTLLRITPAELARVTRGDWLAL